MCGQHFVWQRDPFGLAVNLVDRIHDVTIQYWRAVAASRVVRGAPVVFLIFRNHLSFNMDKFSWSASREASVNRDFGRSSQINFFCLFFFRKGREEKRREEK